MKVGRETVIVVAVVAPAKELVSIEAGQRPETVAPSSRSGTRAQRDSTRRPDLSSEAAAAAPRAGRERCRRAVRRREGRSRGDAR